MTQTFGEEVKDRAAEQSPFWGIPRMVATENMRAGLHDFRHRVHDGRRKEMIANGLPDPGPLVDDMGDINVSGDTIINNPPPPAQPVPPPPKPEPAVAPPTNTTTEKITTT